MIQDENTRPADAGPAPRHAVDASLAAAVQGARMPIVLADARQSGLPIVFANRAFLELTGYEEAEVIGRNCRFLQGRETDRETVARLRDAIAAGESVSVELLNYRKDGSRFWNALHVSPVQDASGQVTHYFGSQVDVSPRKEVELEMIRQREALTLAVAESARRTERALAQKTALLHEVDHRIKNNLQLIASLLLLQSRRIADDTARAALRSMLERVNAVATVHRRLFQSEDIQRFELSDFVRDLTGEMLGSTGREDIRLRLQLERIEVPAAQAAPIALILNELFANALKHGAPAGERAEIEVRLQDLNGAFELVVTDHGPGFPDPAAPPQGFGLTIVHLLAQQLRAAAQFSDAQPGVKATVRSSLHPPA